MNKYIVAGIMSVAIMASGCGDFVRDELITMQNEIDLLYTQVEQMNKGLSTLHGIVNQMASNGYIVKVEETQEDGHQVYKLRFRTVKLGENGSIVAEDTYTIPLISGVDGVDGQDADPFIVGVKKDTVDGRWYWYDVQGDTWMKSPEGDRFLVDGKHGKTPELKVENGYWCISWDGGKEWTTTEWKAKGEDAKEIFSDAKVLDDRIELTLAADSTVLTLLRYLPVEVILTSEGKELSESMMIAPGETVPIEYTLKGTDAEKALVVAGTDGRFKTAIQRVTDTTGVVKVTCPETFPEGGYIYITVNDGNGRSTVQLVHFVQRSAKIIYGKTEYSAKADGETDVKVTFEANFELEAKCVYPDGGEPWITAIMETSDNITSLTYSVKANTTAGERSAFIVITSKDNPGYEVARITVKQAGKA